MNIALISAGGIIFGGIISVYFTDWLPAKFVETIDNTTGQFPVLLPVYRQSRVVTTRKNSNLVKAGWDFLAVFGQK